MVDSWLFGQPGNQVPVHAPQLPKFGVTMTIDD